MSICWGDPSMIGPCSDETSVVCLMNLDLNKQVKINIQYHQNYT